MKISGAFAMAGSTRREREGAARIAQAVQQRFIGDCATQLTGPERLRAEGRPRHHASTGTGAASRHHRSRLRARPSTVVSLSGCRLCRPAQPLLRRSGSSR